jgi:hypothetical protein
MIRSSRRRRWERAITAAALVTAAPVMNACGGPSAEAPGPAAPAPSTGAAPSAAPSGPVSRVGDVAAAKVYDPAGNASACAPPAQNCPEAPIERAFLDRCKLAGFQIRQCGCETRCSGNVAAASRRYDRSGNAKECAPAKADCTPPQASAAFQDACTERGHHLEVCGCEWLCTGNPTK